MRISLREIQEKCKDFEIYNYDPDIYFENINHDSRVSLPNSLFIPIIGEKFNGHDFIQSALDNGSNISLFQRDQGEYSHYDKPIIVVNNIESALEQITNILVSHISVPIVAITGSTGKTTTREMLSKILSFKGSVLNSDRNFNTLWGNAQLLCKYTNEDFVVLEFGMDRKGEIASQCRGITPDLGILLNVGYVHALSLGGIENVYLAKKELADYLGSELKTLVLNIDDNRLSRLINEYPGNLITVGDKGMFSFNNVHVDKDGTHFILKYLDNEYSVDLKVLGKGYVYNAVCAIACGIQLGLNIDECVVNLKEYSGFKGRFELVKLNDTVTVVNDAYNANPTSMEMSLNTFNEIWGKDSSVRKILVLGDMKELGDVTESEHSRMGNIVKRMNVDDVYYMGDYYSFFNYGKHVNTIEELARELKVESNIPTVILLKASNSVGLSNVLELLK